MISTGPQPPDLQRITLPLPLLSPLDLTIRVSNRTLSPGIAINHRLQRGHRTDVRMALAVTVSEAWATVEPLNDVSVAVANIAEIDTLVNVELLKSRGFRMGGGRSPLRLRL
jgi:hypothetical protein